MRTRHMTRHTIGREAPVNFATRKRAAAWLGILVAALLWPRSTYGQNVPHDLGDMTLEELLNLHVTTATKTSERSTAVPAHVEVVTAETIRVRGYRSLADVLRDLPDFKVDVGTDQDRPTD